MPDSQLLPFVILETYNNVQYYQNDLTLCFMWFTISYQDLFLFSTRTEVKKQMRKSNAFLISS